MEMVESQRHGIRKLEEGVLHSSATLSASAEASKSLTDSVTPLDNSERKFSYAQYLDVMKTADMFKEFANEDAIRKRVQQRMSEIGDGGLQEDNYSLTQVYRMGEKMGYSREQILRAIDMKCPSPKVLLEDMREVGAMLDGAIKERHYKSEVRRYGESLLGLLQSTFPMQEFKMDVKNALLDGFITLKFSKKAQRKRKFWFGYSVNWSPVAKMWFDLSGRSSREASTSVYDPLFLRACKNEFPKCEKVHAGITTRYIRPIIHYDVETSERL